METTHSFVLTTGDPKRDLIDPDVLRTVDVIHANQADIDSLLDFIARYVRKVHSGAYIRSTMKLYPRDSFLDFIGANNIAYLLAVFKNGQHMWDQDIRTKAGGEPEKKEKPRFSTGEGKKREEGKSLWNNEGKKYFRAMEGKWKKIYDSKEAMTVLYNMWDNWIESKGKEIQVGDGSKTFHYVMGTWYDDDETGGLKDTNDDIGEDEDKDGYSSDRNHSRHRRAWMKGELVMDDNTQREEKKANIYHTSRDDDDSSGKGQKKILFEAPSDSDEEGSSDSGSSIVTRKGVLGSSPVGMTAAGISGGSPAGNTRKRGGKGTTAAGISGGSPAANTRGRGGTEKKRKR